MYRRGALVDKLCLIAYGNERTHQAASGSLLLAHSQLLIGIHRQLAGIGQHHILPGIHPGIGEHQTALVHRQQVGVQHAPGEGVLHFAETPIIRLDIGCRHDDGARRHPVILDNHSGAALAVERADDTGPLAIADCVVGRPGIVTVRRHPAVVHISRRDDQVDLAGVFHLLQRVLVLHAADSRRLILSLTRHQEVTQSSLAFGNRGQHLRLPGQQCRQHRVVHLHVDIQLAAARLRIQQRSDLQHRSLVPVIQIRHPQSRKIQFQRSIICHCQGRDDVIHTGDAQCTARGIVSHRQRSNLVAGAADTQLAGRGIQ